MSIVNPLLENEDFEALQRAIVWVKVELGEGANQGCAYITARAVDKNAITIGDKFSHSLSTGQNVFNVSKPICLDDLSHQILFRLLNAVPAQY